MSKIEVNTVDKASGSTVTIGGSGTNVTLGVSGQTVTIPSGVTLTNSGTATGFGSDSDISWQAVVTSNTTMVAGRGYFVNTTGGAITMTLPASPSIGDTVMIVDYASTFATNNLTLNRNSSKIEGADVNATLSTNDQTHTLVFTDSTQGWKIVNQDTYTNIQNQFIAATGGTATTSGDYKIHTFNSTSNFVVSQTGAGTGPTSVEYVVVGGGASGGSGIAGGGGAGGFRESKSPVAGTYTASPLATPTAITVAAQTYPITVGGGGAATGPGNIRGTNGSNSVFSTITSAGGGAGSGYASSANTGGSGGGGSGGGPAQSGAAGNTPPVSPPQGLGGGEGAPGNNRGGGGGGGASAAGSDTTNLGANGGNGTSTAITGSAVTRAGGGGGGSDSTGGTGGSGGGGTGGTSTSAPSVTTGTANTGGGGGGGGQSVNGKAGGSGVVILRYKYQ